MTLQLMSLLLSFFAPHFSIDDETVFLLAVEIVSSGLLVGIEEVDLHLRARVAADFTVVYEEISSKNAG